MPTEVFESTNGGLQTGGSAEALFYVNISINFNWVTNSSAVIEQSFYWDVGATRQKWYRVTGRCEYITDMPVTQDENDQPIPDPSGRTVKKATAPLVFDDPSCDGKDQKHFFIQTVLARNPWEVCNKLKETNFIWKISTMQEHGCPANLTEKLDTEDCNALYDVEFCGYPECADFCVDFIAYVQIGATVASIDQELGAGEGNTYKFSSDFSDGCPDSGYIKINQPEANLAETSYIYISNFDFDGNDQTDWYQSFNSYIGPIKGEIVFYDLAGNEILVFYVIAPVEPDEVEACYKILVKFVEGEVTPDEDQEVIITFSPDFRNPTEFVPESDLDVIEPIVKTVRPSCATYFVDNPCMDLPYQLYCHHNLADYTGIFTKFLKRNAFSIDPAVRLQYNVNRDAWAGTMFFVGSGDVSDNFIERWKFIFEWSCLPINQAVGLLAANYAPSIMYGEDITTLPVPSQIGFTSDDVQVAVWFLRFWAQRKKINLKTSEEINYNTFFYAIFHAGLVCQYFKNGLLDFNFDFYFDSGGNYKVPPSEILYQSSLIDRIGFFKRQEQEKLSRVPFYFRLSYLDSQLPPDQLDISSLLR